MKLSATNRGRKGGGLQTFPCPPPQDFNLCLLTKIEKQKFKTASKSAPNSKGTSYEI